VKTVSRDNNKKFWEGPLVAEGTGQNTKRMGMSHEYVGFYYISNKA
jgi:hypothetical protein